MGSGCGAITVGFLGAAIFKNPFYESVEIEHEVHGPSEKINYNKAQSTGRSFAQFFESFALIVVSGKSKMHAYK
jgi:hypothetical protein